MFQSDLPRDISTPKKRTFFFVLGEKKGIIWGMNIKAILEENTSLKVKNKQLESAYIESERQLEWLKKQMFGKRSERVVDTPIEQLTFESFACYEPEKARAIAIKAHKRHKRKGHDKITLPNDLPVKTTVIDLPESEKICPKTGKLYPKVGEEITNRLGVIPQSFFIKRTIRPKYASEENIKIGSLPDPILGRCQADTSLLADIAVKKFADHLPLYRISEIYARSGVGISRQLLSQWMVKLGAALKPLHEALLQEVLKTGCIFMDESPVRVLAPGKGKCHTAYVWEVAAKPGLIYYQFCFTRKYAHLTSLIKDFKGLLHSDKYGAYEEFGKKNKSTWCPCLAHIRRKFFESAESEFRTKVLQLIRHIYFLERVALSRSAEERLEIREQKEAPIMDRLIEMCKKELETGSHLPQSKLRKALGYFCGLSPYMKNYTVDAEARVDNNFAERMLRPLAIGRKNWMFIGSDAGGRAAGVLLSLVQSCRSLGINAQEYLEDLFNRYQSHSFNKIEELLPVAWAKDRGLIPDE